jgi:hypothetical protein
MNRDELLTLAARLQRGETSLEDFVARLSRASVADLGGVQLDLDRHRRCGFPEVIFAEGKTPQTLLAIFDRMLAEGVEPLATRVNGSSAEVLLRQYPNARYNPAARTFRVSLASATAAGSSAARLATSSARGRVAIVSAGTSDLPVAEEARETADWMGAEVTYLADAGVAGPQRLWNHLPALRSSDAVVVVAGMEGALPSVVGGLVACPVVAVPTSVGYGASLGGLAALLCMLNSCAANVTVVNIDAGFKGGYVASLIAQNLARARQAMERS